MRKQGTGRSRRASASILTPFLLLLSFLALVNCNPQQPHTVAAAHSNAALTVRTKGQVEKVLDAPLASKGCGKVPPIAQGSSGDAVLISGGLLRSYWLHIPWGYRPSHPYALVLNFHGHGSTATHQERYTGFSWLADQRGFIVAYPQGVVGPDGRTGWASGGPNKPQTNDVLFVSDLLTRLQGELCIDARRIYATGFSNGGGMTSVLACRMARRIAAFAPVSGSYYPLTGGCAPGRPVPILEFHGTNDYTVPYNGRPGQDELATQDWLQAWAARDGCAHGPSRLFAQAGVTELAWSDCQGGVTVEHYRITGGVHVWPGGLPSSRLPPPDRRVSAIALIWQFFAAHPLPASLPQQ